MLHYKLSYQTIPKDPWPIGLISSTDNGHTGGGGGEGEGEGVGEKRAIAGHPNNPSVHGWLYIWYWVCQNGFGRTVGCWTVTMLGALIL